MLEKKLDSLIKEKFNLIYTISLFYDTYLIGGAICDTMINSNIRDLDFVIHSYNTDYVEDFIKRFINKYHLDYSLNHFNGYKIKYNDTEIDLWHTNDLYDSIEYNADGLLYNVQEHKLVSITFDDFLKNGLKRINNNNNLNSKSQSRMLKLQRLHEELMKKGK